MGHIGAQNKKFQTCSLLFSEVIPDESDNALINEQR